MKPRLVAARALLAALIAVSFAAAAAAAAAATPEASERTPAGLVRAALESELGGPSAQRESLLEQALALDPVRAVSEATR
jgi:hypothetical protein